MKRFLIVCAIVPLGACAELTGTAVEDRPEALPVTNEALAAPPPPREARTIEQFDTTTAEQRAAAAAPAAGGRLLGTTVASLGDPARPGFWIMTALAETTGAGRLVYPATGKSVEVELLPLESGSSRVSLAALRVLEAPLTDLPTLEVYAN